MAKGSCVFAVGLPATLLAGVVLLGMATPVMAETLARFLSDALDMARLVAAGRDGVIAASREHHGFLRGELLTRSRINKVVYTSFWATEFDAMEAEKQGLLDAEMALFEPFAAGPAIVEGYEVSALYDATDGSASLSALPR